MNDCGAWKDHEGRVIDFGRTAADYERYRPAFPQDFVERLLQRRWIVPGQRALDLGTGTGALALAFAAAGLQVTGLDIAPELLHVGRQVATKRQLDVSFVGGRAEATGEAAASFDIVSAGQSWWWFDAERAIAEAIRVLITGGRLLIANFSYLPILGNAAERTEDLILLHNPGWPKAGWRGVHPEQVEALDRGGFRDVESFSYVVDVPFSHEAWRGRIRTCNGVGAALSAEQVARFDADLADLLVDEFPGDLSVPHRVFAASGVKGS